MKKRLFDFSPASAGITLAAYALLLTLALMTYLDSGKALFLVVFILLIVSFLFVFAYFVLLSVRLEDDGVRQGKKSIQKKDLICKTLYDYRFKEGVILIRRRSVDYRELSEKNKKKQTIRVQATKSNIKKLNEYAGLALEAPKKPRRGKSGRPKNDSGKRSEGNEEKKDG